MSLPYLLVILNMSVIGLLPFTFFRRGAFNPRWLVTSAPIAVAGWAVLAAWVGVLTPWWGSASPPGVLAVGVALAAVSLLTIGLAVGANRVPLALWHQDEDAPIEIVRWGPYAVVRHPFYTAFLAALVAATCIAPSVFTIASASVGTAALGVTARREERRLLSSPLGEVYAGYAAATGRFVPRLGRLRNAEHAADVEVAR